MTVMENQPKKSYYLGIIATLVAALLLIGAVGAITPIGSGTGPDGLATLIAIPP